MFDQPKVRSGSCSVMTRKYRLERDGCASGLSAAARRAAGPGEAGRFGDRARASLGRHATYIVAACIAGAAR
jgi:hypothetical protein